MLAQLRIAWDDRGRRPGRIPRTPDAAGTVEVGYAIDPAFRRQGHARLGLVEQFCFVQVGEQWDDEDGPGLVLGRPS